MKAMKARLRGFGSEPADTGYVIVIVIFTYYTLLAMYVFMCI